MTEEKTKYCPYCGAQIEYKYSVCPSCGKPQPPIEGVMAAQIRSKKNPWLAFILSLLVTGVGQIYVGRTLRGIAFLSFVLLLSILADDILTFDQLTFIAVAIALVSAIDAYRLAKKMQ